MSNKIGALDAYETDLYEAHGIDKHHKLKCPQCGSDIVYWKEVLFTCNYELNKTRTKIKINPISSQDDSCNMPNGWKCKKCNWIRNDIEFDDDGNIIL